MSENEHFDGHIAIKSKLQSGTYQIRFKGSLLLAHITSLKWKKAALALAWRVNVSYRKGLFGDPHIVSSSDKYNHGLSLTRNIVRWCAVCCVDNISWWRTLQQHLGTPKHQDRLETWQVKESNQQTDLQLVVMAHVEVNTFGRNTIVPT
jgi:hypothetical protein